MRIRPEELHPATGGRVASEPKAPSCPHCRMQLSLPPTSELEDAVGCVVRAEWNGLLLGRSTRAVQLDGVTYLPAVDVRRHYLRQSGTVAVCAQRGDADCFDVLAYGRVLPDAAWSWREPSTAHRLAGWIGFARTVTISYRAVA